MSIGICQLSQDFEFTSIFFNAPASNAEVTCSPEESKTSSSRLSNSSEIAFDLDIGEYTKPIQLGDAVFILYAENIQKEKIQPISEVREMIERSLRQEIAQESVNLWLEDLRSKAYIRYFM